METICPFAEIKLITNNIRARPGRENIIIGFTPHVQVGNGSLYGFFNSPKPSGKEASADFWGSKKGALEQYVNLGTHNPASQGSGSRYFVSIECEGMPDEPMTGAQIDVQGRLLAWLIKEGYAIPLDIHGVKNKPGLVPHFAWMDENHHTCPQGPGLVGPRFPQYTDIVASARSHLGQAPVPQEEDEMKAHFGQAQDDKGALVGPVYLVAPYYASRVKIANPDVTGGFNWLDDMSKGTLLIDHAIHPYGQVFFNNIPDLTGFTPYK